MIVAADTGDQAVQSALNVAYLVLGVVIGVVAGIVLAFVISLLMRAALGRTRIISALLHRTRGPFYWALMAWGAWLGYRIALDIDLQGADASTIQAAGWVTFGHQVLRVLGIAATTWVLYSAMWVVEDAARLRHAADGGVSRRFETQAQVLRRLLQAVVVLIGLSWAVLVTFPGVSTVMSTVLASAGVVSVIAGLAAQATLGNVFAGIQLAFTDAIRVGDVVVVGDNQDSGAIEEITLTYVVVRVWDERRLIMPSTEFASKPFENWTRRAARQLGTIELTLDWAAPMAQIREKVEHLLLATDLWDGRTWSVQMTDSDANSVTVRVLVSAKDSGALWDLRCYLRENLISWISSEEAWARPVVRYQPQDTVTVTHDTSREVVARLATELSGIAGPDTTAGGGKSHTGTDDGSAPAPAQADVKPLDAFHAARVQAARRKAKRARRRALVARQREAASGGPAKDASEVSPAPTDASGVPDSERTRVFTADELQEIARRYDEATATRLAREAPPSPSPDPASTTGASGAGATAGPTGQGGPTGRKLPAGPDQPASVPPASGTASAPAVPPEGGPAPSSAPARGAAARTAQAAEEAASPSSTSGTGVPAQDTPTPPVGKGERLYSGSPDAEERSAIFSGPGDDVMAEREQTAMMRAVRSGSALTGTSAPPTDEGVGVVVKASAESADDGDGTTGGDPQAEPGGKPGGGVRPSSGSGDGPAQESGDGPRIRVATDDEALDATRVMPAIHPDGSGQAD